MKLGERPARVVVRHVLLIRHGQYDDSQKNDDAQNVLTDLGKRQAKTTGERLAHIILQASGSNSDGSCPLKSLSCSSLTRAKQTADIIYEEIQTMISKYNEEKPDQPWDPVERKEPDPLLIEGFPIHHIPGPTGFTGLKVNEIDRDFPRVESAFKKYIATSDWLDRRDWSTAQPQISSKKSPKIDHEYEIVVGESWSKGNIRS
jgi:serine/threonine-protein phosphatase PGAM5